MAMLPPELVATIVQLAAEQLPLLEPCPSRTISPLRRPGAAWLLSCHLVSRTFHATVERLLYRETAVVTLSQFKRLAARAEQRDGPAMPHIHELHRVWHDDATGEQRRAAAKHWRRHLLRVERAPGGRELRKLAVSRGRGGAWDSPLDPYFDASWIAPVAYSLEELVLSRLRFASHEPLLIPRLSHLTLLDTINWEVSNAGIDRFLANFPALRSLELNWDLEAPDPLRLRRQTLRARHVLSLPSLGRLTSLALPLGFLARLLHLSPPVPLPLLSSLAALTLVHPCTGREDEHLVELESQLSAALSETRLAHVGQVTVALRAPVSSHERWRTCMDEAVNEVKAEGLRTIGSNGLGR